MPEHPPSLWADSAAAGPDCPALVGRETADVAIVGGGYTGLSAALHLAREGKQVRLLEAGQPGFGCSGRNGGQVNPGGTRLTPDQIIAALGRDRGERFIAAGHASCDLVFELIAEYDIDCEALRPGYVQGGWGRSGAEFGRRWAEQWRRYGVEIELLDRAALRTLIGSGAYQNGFYDPRGGNVQPLSYARGLARAARDVGALLHGDSRAISIRRDGAGWRVGSDRGEVRAEYLLLCSNGYTDDLWPGLRQTVVPVSSFVTATEPLGQNVLATVLPGRHAVSESSRIIVYYRLDQQGRFIIGGRGRRADVGEPGAEPAQLRHVQRAALRLFPQLAGVRWSHQWGGWPAISRHHLPMLIGLGPGAYAGLGYNGRGVAMATMMGKQLARHVLGGDTLIDAEPLRRYPLHALRQIGISYHLGVGAARDRIERRRAQHR